MRKLVPLFLLGVSLSFGSVIDYTINFYDSAGNPVNTPLSLDGFSYDATAPIGSQFTGFDIIWDSMDIDLGVISSYQVQSFGEALMSDACTVHNWYGTADVDSGGALFDLQCSGPAVLAAGFIPSPLASTQSDEGTYTLSEVVAPEPGTTWLTLIASAVMLPPILFGKKFSRW